MISLVTMHTITFCDNGVMSPNLAVFTGAPLGPGRVVGAWPIGNWGLLFFNGQVAHKYTHK